MQRRRRERDFEIVPNPHRDYYGSPLKNVIARWYDQQGTHHTGTLTLDSLLASLGMVVKPGDVLTITVEVNADHGTVEG